MSVKKTCFVLLVLLLGVLFTGTYGYADGVSTQGIENIPQGVTDYLNRSRWSGWEITGWVTPDGNRSSSTGRGSFADIERTRSGGNCTGTSAGGHRNVLSHDIARGTIERGLESIVLATHGVDVEGGVVRNGSKGRRTRAT